MQLRYMGFDQAKNIREYKFDGAAEGKTIAHFVVSADLALFVKHRVGLQEGPSLCLKRLSTNLLLIRLFQQATSSSVGSWRARSFQRLCANFRRSSPAKRPANCIWLTVVGLMASCVVGADTARLMRWRNRDVGSALHAGIRFL